MTQTMLYLDDAYCREAVATVLESDPSGIILDSNLFYPRSGGQPGDTGTVFWTRENGRVSGILAITDTIKDDKSRARLIPQPGKTLPEIGARVEQRIDWGARYDHMRMHTALHLLSVAVPFPVTGGQITAEKGRLDFDMPDAPADKGAIEDRVNALIRRDLPVQATWISEAELDARPDLVKTMNVKPPRGQGQVRLVRIGNEAEQVDLQPCGGTHVHRTGEIGAIRLGKVEKKGANNRRVSLHFA